mmetsp:Transcript_34823/g.75943  ORF Transcript_34823/g.75943 Transcript_34823/m.75943 type:complete len:693 (-) Transcript_34823:91-2169(-)|eukprot:CAMPEP_0170604520 /NCGR_PEP_ID=MMETSP0224-20130122/19466_1 /TAXON_ID=285029 /ORGANISM="Togula jolla, Strain CCCM 725" /LENGTH=692 /DNA_ID=CAMNT_0010929427 /DNA_START=93 /DNA_END=2171 /DNA_ORIENTATION=+
MTQSKGSDVKEAGTEEAANAESTREATQHGEKEHKSLRSSSIFRENGLLWYFRWRPLPWWVCFLVGIFLLTKLQLVYNDSPCAVLGTQGPVALPDVKKAFRNISMCTHPDRLRGRLKRDPTPAESRRGEILFNRASAAKDHLTKMLKGKKKIPCYQGELELAVLQLMAQATRALSALGVSDYASMMMDLGWNLITFESGFLNTLLSVLWLAFLFRILKQFFMYLWRMGLLKGSLTFVTTVLVGPIPTVVHFIALPVLRLIAFVYDLFEGMRSESVDVAVADTVLPPTTDMPSDAAKKTPTTANLAAATADKELPGRNIRQRKKKETEEEKERRNKELLAGSAEAVAAANARGAPDPTHGAGPMPTGVWQCIRWKHKEQVKARQEASNAVQFDLLLIFTKPIIPLCMLIALGQVWNGLFSSLFIGHALRRWVPSMSYETHHLLCSFFGAMHTLLGVSAQQVEDYATREGVKGLHLAWSWSFKDVLAVMHMTLLGSTVTAASALGNEPSYASSFAAGIALRIALAQDSVRGLGLARTAARFVEGNLRDAGVVLDAAEEVVAYSGDGIGDCGGGPFRMMMGDGPQAQWCAIALKAWLLLLPALAAAHWLQRTIHAARMIGKKAKLTRFLQRLILCALGVLQCFLLASTELNASNGALGNFWVAMLFGCAGESLMSTFDIRGPLRQILLLVLFLLM